MVSEDIVERLRFLREALMGNGLMARDAHDGANEIKRLRASLNIAAGKLSTLPPYTGWHPETIYKALLEDGAEAVRGE